MREFGSTFEIEFLPDAYFANMAKRMSYSAFTRSGREAIGLALESFIPGEVLVPAYCCWSMTMPFESSGWHISYYPIKSDLSVDLASLMSLIESKRPKMVLLVDYFGYTSTVEAVHAIKSFDPQIIIMEDFTQSLFRIDERWNHLVDCYVASIRKSVGIPDGGVVLSSFPLNVESLSNVRTQFVAKHLEAGVLKKKYTYSSDVELKNIFRGLQSEAGAEIKNDYKLYCISNESMAILSNINVSAVSYARRSNYEHLFNLVKDNPYFEVLFQPGENSAPFMFVVKSNKRNLLQQSLAKLGVYCQVIWPVSDAAKEVCAVAKEMEETMLAIPIDQRYDYCDIEEMGQRINSIKL